MGPGGGVTVASHAPRRRDGASAPALKGRADGRCSALFVDAGVRRRFGLRALQCAKCDVVKL